MDYPFPWRYFDEETQQVEKVELGPWDCAMLVPLTAEQCCDMVKSSVPALDVNGRHIECYFEEPEVADEEKVILVWDASTGTVSCLLRRLFAFLQYCHLIVSTLTFQAPLLFKLSFFLFTRLSTMPSLIHQHLRRQMSSVKVKESVEEKGEEVLL